MNLKMIVMIVSVIVIGIVLVVMSRMMGTISEISKSTVFNADKYVVSYEMFRENYESYNRYVGQYCSSKTALESFSGEKSMDNPEYRVLAGDVSSYRKMAADIAQRYNGWSRQFYRRIVKSGDLPEKLEYDIDRLCL